MTVPPPTSIGPPTSSCTARRTAAATGDVRRLGSLTARKRHGHTAGAHGDPVADPFRASLRQRSPSFWVRWPPMMIAARSRGVSAASAERWRVAPGALLSVAARSL
jgi:hypothetical protein